MNKASKISESELEIMKVLWSKSFLSSNEIINLLEHKVNWSGQTIKTFLNRLLNKEVIGFKKEGRNYLYYPLISYEDYIKVENKSFLERIYNGALDMLFSKFIEEEDLTEKDIEKLENILKEKKNDINSRD